MGKLKDNTGNERLVIYGLTFDPTLVAIGISFYKIKQKPK